jgi:hypothetical protein
MFITLLLGVGAVVYAAKNGWLSALESWVNDKREQITSKDSST